MIVGNIYTLRGWTINIQIFKSLICWIEPIIILEMRKPFLIGPLRDPGRKLVKVV
jgi:hypothetical protein